MPHQILSGLDARRDRECPLAVLLDELVDRPLLCHWVIAGFLNLKPLKAGHRERCRIVDLRAVG